MSSHEVLVETAAKIVVQFHIDPPPGDGLTRSLLIERLRKVINHLLDNDFSQLLTIFYRIDLKEETVKRILTNSPPHEMAQLLAEEVVKREEQKIISRNQYGD